MRVRRPTLLDQGESSKGSKTEVPASYGITLRFPEYLAGYEVLFSGSNCDFESGKFACANDKIEGLKDGDWVRVFGVLRPKSRIEWNLKKSNELLYLGEMIISDIQKADAGEE